MNLIISSLLALLGNSVIYAGLAFINGTLLPKLLASIYGQTGPFLRLVIMSILFAPLANFLFSRVYKYADTAYAGMIMLGSLVIVLVIKALLIEGGSLNFRVVTASVILTLCAIWVSYELHHAK